MGGSFITTTGADASGAQYRLHGRPTPVSPCLLIPTPFTPLRLALQRPSSPFLRRPASALLSLIFIFCCWHRYLHTVTHQHSRLGSWSEDLTRSATTVKKLRAACLLTVLRAVGPEPKWLQSLSMLAWQVLVLCIMLSQQALAPA